MLHWVLTSIGCLISPLILSNARYFPSFKKTAATLCAWGLARCGLMTDRAHSHVVTCASCWEKRVFNPVDVVMPLTCHFIIEFLDFFGYSRGKFLIRYVAGKYFIPFRDSSAHVPDGALGITRAFMFDEIHFVYFRSIGCALVLHVRNCKAGAPSREESEVHPPWGGVHSQRRARYIRTYRKFTSNLAFHVFPVNLPLGEYSRRSAFV